MEYDDNIVNEFISDDIFKADYVLDSVFEIDTILRLVKEEEKKAEFLRNYKKFKNDQISVKLELHDEKIKQLRNIIKKTLSHFEEKSLDFPGLGKVSRRNNKDSWSIEDEQKLLQFFKKEGIADHVVKVKETVDKREALKYIENYTKQGIGVPGVMPVKGLETLIVIFEKDSDTTENSIPQTKPPTEQKHEPSSQLNKLEL
jgi:phage host-nuclease inhibitor protein Gam